MGTVVDRGSPTANIIQGLGLGIVLAVLSYFVGVQAGWIESVNLLEAFAVFTSYWSTYLCVKERRFNYPLGALSNAAYAVLFLSGGLVASAALTAFLVPYLVYGYIRWGKDRAARPVTRVAPKMIPIYLGVTAVGYVGIQAILVSLGTTLPMLDTGILVLSLLAQLLLDNKKVETWGVWAVVNVLAIYTYFTAGLFLVFFQYIFFMANTVYGAIEWNRSKRNAESLHADDRPAADAGTPAPVAVPVPA